MQHHMTTLTCRDLVFPHHENELAQSRAAVGSCSCGHDHSHDGDSSSPDFVRYWVHNGKPGSRRARGE